MNRETATLTKVASNGINPLLRRVIRNDRNLMLSQMNFLSFNEIGRAVRSKWNSCLTTLGSCLLRSTNSSLSSFFYPSSQNVFRVVMESHQSLDWFGWQVFTETSRSLFYFFLQPFLCFYCWRTPNTMLLGYASLLSRIQDVIWRRYMRLMIFE